MPVVEYMLHVYDGDHRRHIPGFIHDRGHWHNELDHTFVGWVRTKNDFYVPDTLLTLSKEDFVQRCLRIHQVQPIQIRDPNSAETRVAGMINVMITLQTDQQVREFAEKWYDDFVTRNLQEESGS